MKKPKVLIVSTGGTIASTYKDGEGYSPAMDIKELLYKIPGIKTIAEIQTKQFCNVLSFALTPQKVVEIVGWIRDKIDEFDGAIVIQGTATMEETSYLADLLWDSEKPLVFTGAMFSASEWDSDGPRNIANSVLVAINPGSRNKGVMVCMAGEIHAARDVVKMHKTSLSAFVSVNTGPLGIVNKNGVIFNRQVIKRKIFNSDEIEERIDIIKVALGSDSRLLEASVASGAKGLVIEAFPGGGGVTPAVFEAVKKARKQDVFIVMTPRSILGSVVAVAGGGFGPWDLKQQGVIMGGDLSSVKARVLMMLALPVVKNADEMETIFKEIAP